MNFELHQTYTQEEWRGFEDVSIIFFHSIDTALGAFFFSFFFFFFLMIMLMQYDAEGLAKNLRLSL